MVGTAEPIVIPPGDVKSPVMVRRVEARWRPIARHDPPPFAAGQVTFAAV
jgi:hypothetical protein